MPISGDIAKLPGDSTSIEWMLALARSRGMRAAVWNPWRGCLPISQGCKFCWAAPVADMRGRQANAKQRARYGGLTERNADGVAHFTGAWHAVETDFDLPVRTMEPTCFFTFSESDFGFGPSDALRDEVLGIIAVCERHLFVMLGKRPDYVADYMARDDTETRVWDIAVRRIMQQGSSMPPSFWTWPLPNLWVGCSICTRNELRHLDALRRTPAAKRVVSFEPLLEDMGDVDLTGIDWVIAGEESASAARRRVVGAGPFCRLRDRSKRAGAAFFLKQMWRGERLYSMPAFIGGRMWAEVPS